MRLMVSLTLSFWAANAYAQDISIKTRLIAPGSKFVIEDSNGDAFIHLYSGKGFDGYFYQVFRKPSASYEPVYTAFGNENGDKVIEFNESGEAIEYQPHDCSRTIGTCEFIRAVSDSEPEKFRRETKATSDGFEYSIYADGKLVETGRSVLDEMGIDKLRERSVPNGEKFTAWMLSSDYK